MGARTARRIGVAREAVKTAFDELLEIRELAAGK
jgi:hypothetical protein